MNVKALIAEFIGTFALCFMGIFAIYNLGAHATDGGGLIGIAFAHGIAILVFGTAFGSISGGHFNPAVTLGFLVVGRIKAAAAGSYILCQILGGFAVGLIASQLPNFVQAKNSPSLSPGISPTLGIGLEVIATFFLMMVVYGTAVDKRAPKMGALFIGLVIVGCIFAIGPLTGAALNPARFFGPNLAGGAFDNALVYLIGPIVGAVLAALLYEKVLLTDQT